MIKRTKSLYNFNKIRIKSGGLIFVIRKEYEENVILLSIRLADLVTHFNLITKSELVKLLDKLNKLSDNVEKEAVEFAEAIDKKEKVGVGVFLRDSYRDLSGITYIIGKISLLRSLINTLIEKLEDIEQETKLTEEQEEKQQEIIERSRKGEELDYLG